MTTAPRPRSVTLACLFIGLSCLIVMFSIIGQLSNWGSLELQEQVANALDSGPLAELSLTVSEALAFLRWVFFGVLVLSIAGVVFAIFTARGDRTSRNFLTGVWAIVGWSLAGAGGLSIIGLALAVVLIYLLWMPESRQWFAAVNSDEPAPSQPNAFAATPALSVPTPSGQRPRSIAIAATITLIGSGIVAFGSVFMLAGMALVGGDFDQVVADNAQLREGVADLGMTADQVFQVTLVLMASSLVLALAGIGSALWALAGKPAGRTALVVVTSVTLVASIVGFSVGIPWTIAAIVVLVQLRSAESKAWFSTT